MQDHDWDRVQCECRALLRQAIERICELTDLPPLYPLDSDLYSQMGIAPLPSSNLTMLKSRLYDECKIEIPLIQWQDQQFVRISIQGYNTSEDVDSAGESFANIIAAGHCLIFLHGHLLYCFWAGISIQAYSIKNIFFYHHLCVMI